MGIVNSVKYVIHDWNNAERTGEDQISSALLTDSYGNYFEHST